MAWSGHCALCINTLNTVIQTLTTLNTMYPQRLFVIGMLWLNIFWVSQFFQRSAWVFKPTLGRHKIFGENTIRGIENLHFYFSWSPENVCSRRWSILKFCKRFNHAASRSVLDSETYIQWAGLISLQKRGNTQGIGGNCDLMNRNKYKIFPFCNIATIFQKDPR